LDCYSAEKVHARVDYARYIYRNVAKHPIAFENFNFPIAVYEQNGKIAGANWVFRYLTGIEPDDIHSGRANIFDLIIDKDSEFAEFTRLLDKARTGDG